jgi:hypothetical protein
MAIILAAGPSGPVGTKKSRFTVLVVGGQDSLALVGKETLNINHNPPKQMAFQQAGNLLK